MRFDEKRRVYTNMETGINIRLMIKEKIVGPITTEGM